LLDGIVIKMSVCVAGKTAPVFLTFNIVLVVDAAVFFVELPESGVINAEDLGNSVNLS
jgi:hypothetical protein